MSAADHALSAFDLSAAPPTPQRAVNRARAVGSPAAVARRAVVRPPRRARHLSLTLVVLAHVAGLHALTRADWSPVVIPGMALQVALIEAPIPAPVVEAPPARVEPPPRPLPEPVARPKPPRPVPAKPAPQAPTTVSEAPTALTAEESVPEPAEAPAAAPQVAAAAPAPAAAARGAPGPSAPTVTAARFDADYLNNPAPAYPALSRRMREEGRVMLRVHVSAEGLPKTIELNASSGSGRLDNAARDAVQRWRFVPARRGEQAVDAWVLVPIVFKLEGS